MIVVVFERTRARKLSGHSSFFHFKRLRQDYRAAVVVRRLARADADAKPHGLPRSHLLRSMAPATRPSPWTALVSSRPRSATSTKPAVHLAVQLEFRTRRR